MAYRGRYTPKNPKKYTGDPTNIKYDSGWERRVCKFCDLNPDIIEWVREPLAIPYYSIIDKKMHKYYVDFYIKANSKTSKDVQVYLVEVKPYKQTIKPVAKYTKKTKRPTRRFIREQVTYVINTAKWEAARKVCESKGWKFLILHEKNSKFT
jgi:hypothetical protein